MQIAFSTKRILFIVSILTAGVTTDSFALNCDCSDWMNKGGYCVDYIKEKIPSFPIPKSTTEIATLKNRDISDIDEGDVAMFNYSNYWHVAYVERVHRNQQGLATAIDVSEMNFGDKISFDEFKTKWKSKHETEWRRALCCGVTENYDETGMRKKVSLNTVKQVWSPDSAPSDSISERVADKVREVINRLLYFKERAL